MYFWSDEKYVLLFGPTKNMHGENVSSSPHAQNGAAGGFGAAG
jgi:hypothetical protein